MHEVMFPFSVFFFFEGKKKIVTHERKMGMNFFPVGVQRLKDILPAPFVNSYRSFL